MQEFFRITEFSTKQLKELDLFVEVISPPIGPNNVGHFINLHLNVTARQAVTNLIAYEDSNALDKIYPIMVQEIDGVFKTTFLTLISTIGIAPQFVLNFVADFQDGRRGNVVAIRGERHQPISHQSSLTPILVDGLPRSGTTILMSYLLNHPAIVGKREYPYEFRLATYWAHLFMLMTKVNNSKPGDKNWQATQNNNAVGAPTYFNFEETYLSEWFGNSFTEKAASFCISAIEDNYRILKEKEDKPISRYFCEKFPDNKYKYFCELFPKVISILIVRDIRDVFCSVRSFNQKRGYAGFGVEKFKSEANYLINLGKSQKANLLRRMNNSRNIEYHIVKYEEFVRDPVKIVQRIYKDIGLDEVEISSCMGSNHDHVTNKKDWGIERWRQDMSVELQRVALEHHQDLFKEFGYPTE
ncbi:sulfotransferase [Nitrosomonas sp. Is37]|uniref:sulfotransferase family protein n=1 Tax=Nitrosomonas sp. Is37 TaxID=3080535 RepID=UPI00294AABFB|nr:sulfotransferase [Nitrosomonas sp. Is37]MDV6344887.1 sulfotransferase [Nitrosomonas sp. Is37]